MVTWNFMIIPWSCLTQSCRQSLYDNEQQIQDHFAQFWAQVAQRFKDNPYVLGYELLNEPWAGDVYRHPDHFEPSA
jgi:endoglycosylceramidase